MQYIYYDVAIPDKEGEIYHADIAYDVKKEDIIIYPKDGVGRGIDEDSEEWKQIEDYLSKG